MTSLEQHLEWFKDHELIVQTTTSSDLPVDPYPVQVFSLKKPGTWAYSCQITFSPEGIAIQGDITPEDNNGSCSRGKGLDWFVGKLDKSYLASKFLKVKWSEELCKRDLNRRIEEAPWTALYRVAKADNDELEKLRGLRSTVCFGEYEFHQTYEAMGLDSWGEDIPGWGYAPQEVAILAAIQQTFRRLYWEREGSER